MDSIINLGWNKFLQKFKMKNYAVIDSSKFPLINIVFTGNEATEKNFTLYLDELSQIYSKQTKIAVIFDATKAIIPGIKYQKLQAKWLKDNKEMMVSYCLGTAYIIPSLLIRNVLKAIFSIQKQPVDYTVCKNQVEAIDWANKKLN